MSVKPTNIPKCHLRQSADSAGNFSRHGKLGEVTDVFRTFVLPYENGPYTFNMKFVYDSWNRIQEMTYPDGEVVVYGYNSGGMLSSMTGAKNGLPYKYIESIRYNEFELKAAMYYGNGTKTIYRYDTLQRLSNLYSQTSANEPMQDIVYTYDSVSNIIDITNYASTLLNGLGGKYGNTYQYDNLYRLVYSAGTWYGIHPVGYKLDMEYTPNGRIVKKYLDADTYTQTPTSSNQFPVIYQNDYHYDDNIQPNTLIYIDNSANQYFKWDVKGNMTWHLNTQTNTDRYLCWDEQNRLLGVKDNMQRLSYYQYDANGDRVYKLTGDPVRQNRNGEWRYSYLMNRPTLYASPYVVTNPQGYTKHYYAESERVASRIGGGGLLEIDRNDNQELLASHKERSIKLFAEVMECLGAQAVVETSPLQFLYSWKQVVYPETDCYWYHPDHLGSSSWITYTDGSAVEHLHYMPWGEDFVRQRSTNWYARYTFSAKEKDAETGFSYFGSRYYSSDLSIWLSVDPQASKYPSLSPYVYCANNPIKLVDPNGETIVIQGEDGEHTFTPGQQCNSTDKNVQAAWNNLDKMYGTEAGKTVITEMTKDGSPTFTFTNESRTNDGTGRFQKDGNKGGTMYMGGKLNEGDYLAHELFHGYQELKGQGGASIHNEVEANLFSMLTVGGGLVLGPKGGTKEGDLYSEAYVDFQCRRINETNFTEKFNTLRDGFKSKSIANSTRLYERFDIGEHTPSLIKSFYK